MPLLVWSAPCLAQDQAAAAPPPADRPDLTATIGASVWDGDFGAATNTNIASALVGLRYRVDGLRLSASLPYMRIRSDGTFFAGLGGTPLFVAPTIAATRRVREGFGDLTLGASYLLPGGDARGFDIDLSGRVKLPTASDDSQLSTGKVDYSVGAEVSKTIGRLSPSIAATYRVFGDNRAWNFRDGFDVTAGASYALTRGLVVLANYEFTQASSRFIDDAHELVAGLSAPIGDNGLRLNAYAAKGLSNGAADVSGGASLSLKF